MVHILEKIEKYAIDNDIPIMMKDGIEFLEDYIKKHNVKNILEIGTAIGYSAIKMCVSSSIHVTTIERDEVRYNQALKNVELCGLNNQITLINDDAFNVCFNETFDLIFIDAAKGQYIKFFEKFKNNLTAEGVIVSDNLNFHGYTFQEERIQSKNLRQLVNKLRKYIVFLKENDEFETEFFDIGDGIGITRRK